MKKNILLLCCGYPFETDKGFGYHVAKVLEKMKLPENVDFMEVGESACMIPGFIEGKEKLIVVDFFQTGDEPGTIVRLKQEEVPLTVNGVTDVPKLHLIENLEHIAISGKLPDTVFIGVVPKDIKTEGIGLTPEVEKKIPEVIDMVMDEIKRTKVPVKGN